MVETVYLHGAEQVREAARQMSEAAARMDRAANTIAESLDQFQRRLQDQLEGAAAMVYRLEQLPRSGTGGAD